MDVDTLRSLLSNPLMDLWNTARPGRPPRIMVMAGWGGQCFGGVGTLLLHYTEAVEMLATCNGDASWAVDKLIPVIQHELSHGTRTMTTIRTTGLAA